MERIGIEDVKPGMVLGEELKDWNARFLLCKGTQLTEKHLRIFKIWGITEVCIEGTCKKEACPDASADIDAALLQKASQYTRARFLHMDPTHPAIRELYRVCTIRNAQLAAEKGWESLASSCAPIKHQPASSQKPEKPIERVNLQKMMRDGTIVLPTLPIIFQQLCEAVENPCSSARNIADVISKDTSLSAKLLRLVNSPFYGFPSKVDSLSRAVMILGTKQLSTLAIGVVAISTFKGIPNSLVNMKSFWMHTMACGLIARIIGRLKNVSNSERLFVGGLLHDIGRMILYGHLSGSAMKALVTAHGNKSILYDVEREVIGYSHTYVGGTLLNIWKLPDILEAMVRYHHEPFKSQYPLDVSMIHVADVIANALGGGSSGERLVPPMDPKAWEEIAVPTGALKSIIIQFDHQIKGIAQLLFADE